jgi:hypothetical protein
MKNKILFGIMTLLFGVMLVLSFISCDNDNGDKTSAGEATFTLNSDEYGFYHFHNYSSNFVTITINYTGEKATLSPFSPLTGNFGERIFQYSTTEISVTYSPTNKTRVELEFQIARFYDK